MFRFFQFGNEPNFFRLLHEQAELADAAARQLHDGCCGRCDLIGKAADAIHLIEEQSEEKRKLIARLIDTSFVTPLDKEDLDHISRYFHRIVSAIHGSARRLALYPLGGCRDDLPAMTTLVVQMTRSLVKAMTLIETHQQWALVPAMLEGLHELEKEADRMLQHSLAALFNDTSLDVLKVIQWKEIYECVEDATDRCQDAADLLERAGVKYA